MELSHCLQSSEPTAIESLLVPSPVRLLEPVSRRAQLWVKDDSRLHPIYGGNKCRKLVHILTHARSRGKSHVVTFGAAGSHHVLATGLFARAWGMRATAFLVPQPWSLHAQEVLHASVNAPMELLAAGIYPTTLRAALACLAPDCQLIAPGGSCVRGSMGYFEAALELAAQVRAGQVPEPDVIVVAFGSAGTAAGLWAGLEHAGMRSRIIGVSVLHARGRVLYAERLARRVLAMYRSKAELDLTRFSLDSGWVGDGYGIESAATRASIECGASLDLPLDPTYTAKAFACALALVIDDRIGAISAAHWPNDSPAPRNVLYWHTLGAMTARQESADANPIPANLASLLRVRHSALPHTCGTNS